VVCWNDIAGDDYDTLDDTRSPQQTPEIAAGSDVSLSTPTIAVLYEDDRVLVIDKPEGIAHHDRDDELGILSVVRRAQAFGKLHYQGRLYGVHRLDRVTSGILMLAKDADTASTLTRAFRDGTVAKYYVGVSTKRRSTKKKKQGWVRGRMARGRRKSWHLTRERNDGDSPSHVAVTRFFTASLSSLRDSAAVQDDALVAMTCLLFRPYTGRTHQLRVAAKSLGMPLLGDPIYKDGFVSTTTARTCLHSSAIHVDLDDGPITIWSPPPFHHLWNSKESKEAFDAILVHLMQKHCDCDLILEKMKGHGL
jgi:23S rRNA-/tRNA-specific pseudouridylate synthase